MLTTEELLIKRYKCIAPFPFQLAKGMYKVGDILTDDGKTTVRNQHGDPVFAIKWEDYPHLFQPLPWWSDREIGDLPEFVKSIKQEYSYGVEVGRIIKVKEWVLLSKTPYVIQSKNREYHPACFEPATPEQYNQQKEGMNGGK